MKGDRRVRGRFLQYLGGLHISAVTLGELSTWANRAKPGREKREQALAELLDDVVVLPVDEDLAHIFGRIRASLLDQGVSVPVNDMFIAAGALRDDLTVVTHNVRHFGLVPGLRVADWLIP